MILKVTRSEASEKTYLLTLESCGVSDPDVTSFFAKVELEVLKAAFPEQPAVGSTYTANIEAMEAAIEMADPEPFEPWPAELAELKPDAPTEPPHEEASSWIPSRVEADQSEGERYPSESGSDAGSGLEESLPSGEEGQLPAEPSEVTELVPPREPPTDPDVA